MSKPWIQILTETRDALDEIREYVRDSLRADRRGAMTFEQHSRLLAWKSMQELERAGFSVRAGSGQSAVREAGRRSD